jgi:hypothetical protein
VPMLCADSRCTRASALHACSLHCCGRRRGHGMQPVGTALRSKRACGCARSREGKQLASCRRPGAARLGHAGAAPPRACAAFVCQLLRAATRHARSLLSALRCGGQAACGVCAPHPLPGAEARGSTCSMCVRGAAPQQPASVHCGCRCLRCGWGEQQRVAGWRATLHPDPRLPVTDASRSGGRAGVEEPGRACQFIVLRSSLRCAQGSRATCCA